MHAIRIGSNERHLDDASEGWIVEQVKNRQADGHAGCVQVVLRNDSLNMVLSTPACVNTGSGRAPKANEREIFELWEKRGLNQTDWAVGKLIAFIKQLRRLV